uniref:DUF433 domain-containing protein n=1 Tax=Steinernema glaseri TaxID=37863 RepID=A0A1I7YW01_9BILA
MTTRTTAEDSKPCFLGNIPLRAINNIEPVLFPENEEEVKITCTLGLKVVLNNEASTAIGELIINCVQGIWTHIPTSTPVKSLTCL